MSASPLHNPHLDHLFLVGVLATRASSTKYPKATRVEAAHELEHYRNEGLIQQSKEASVAKAKTRSEILSETEPEVFSGQGVIFAVIDDREQMEPGKVTTIDVITAAIEGALDAGHEDSESIARYITTSGFQHVTDKRMRFNSVLKAGDAVGAQITRKLYNAYNELVEMADEEDDPRKKAEIKAEATGFAEALNVVISPFSCEYEGDPRLVNWEEVDRITAAFEKEQRFVRKERKGNPQ